MSNSDSNVQNDHQSKTITVTLDSERFSRKPRGSEISAINARIGSRPVTLTVEQLSEQIVQPNGRTWCCGVFDLTKTGGRKTNEAWKNQQVFALDFDNKHSETDPDFTPFLIHDAIARCHEFGINPAFAYSTFSSVTNEKYRLVFVLPFVVEHSAIRSLIQGMLMKMFPESDQCIHDEARLMFGGKELLYSDFNTTLDFESLVHGFHTMVRSRNKTNANRDIREFARRIGIGCTDGCLEIEFIDLIEDEDSIDAVLEDVPVSGLEQHHRVIYMELLNPRRIAVLHLANSHRLPTTPIQQEGGVEKDKGEVGGEYEQIQHPNWDRIVSTCPIFASFMKQDHRFRNHERLFLAMNLKYINGGLKRMMDVLRNSIHDYNMDRVQAMIAYIRQSRYHPMTYRRMVSDWEYTPTTFASLYHAAKTVSTKQDFQLQTPPRRELKELEAALESTLDDVIQSQPDGVYVIKAPTGIGKTEAYLKYAETIAVALPRHDVLQEVYQRFSDRGVTEIITTPEYPENVSHKDVDSVVKGYWDVGAFKTAQQYLKNDVPRGMYPDIDQYLLDKERCKNVQPNELFLTTHEHLIHSCMLHDCVIIDEDIMDSLLQTITVRYDAFLECCHAIRMKSEGFNCQHVLNDEVKAALKEVVQFTDQILGPTTENHQELTEVAPIDKVWTPQVEAVVQSVIADVSIRVPILKILESRWFKRDQSGCIHFGIRKELPGIRKVIVLSATADRWMYEQFFGDRLKGFHDLGYAQPGAGGRVIQYYTHSFSRRAMSKMNGANRFIEEEFGDDYERITFKTYEAGLCSTYHYGGISGRDELCGRNTVVIGTPFMPTMVYDLKAAMIGHPVPSQELHMNNYFVERNGMRFRFFTFKHEALQKVQLHSIESEMIQAVGRSRTLRTNAMTYVLSSYPLPIADEFKELSDAQIQKLRGQDNVLLPAE